MPKSGYISVRGLLLSDSNRVLLLNDSGSSPRNMGELLERLLSEGPPAHPVEIHE